MLLPDDTRVGSAEQVVERLARTGVGANGDRMGRVSQSEPRFAAVGRALHSPRVFEDAAVPLAGGT